MVRTPGLSSLAVCLAVATLPNATFGQYENLEGDPSPFSEAELLSEQVWVQPGETFTLGLRLLMDEGWHSYWINPGDSGEPTEITWTLPDGFAAGPIQWPFPEKIDGGPLRSYGYSDAVVLLTDIAAPASLEPGAAVKIAATADWLICADVCLFAEETDSLTLPVRADDAPSGDAAAIFAHARAQLPMPAAGWDMEAARYSNSFALRIKPPGGIDPDLVGAYFFPTDLLLLEHAVEQPVSRDGKAFVIALQQSEYAEEVPERLTGVLVARKGQHLDDSGSRRALAIDVPIQFAASSSAESATSSMLLLLLFGLVGGVLLNLMPCVFPVLSVKVLGFAQHRSLKAGPLRSHGLVFAGGVIVSFWILAGLLLVLRAAGSQIGWGFQLQAPLFVAGMALLFFAIGLNLLGVFDVGALSIPGAAKTLAGGGYARSFLDGVLATLVATPCTAPFMGAALGAAVVLAPLQALLIFTALGAGMAAPYVVLSMMPRLLGRLPRPGAWMETLKHILAFPMIATTVWLVWVFGRQVGVDGVAFLLVGLLLLGVALWILGRWPAAQLSLRGRLATRIVAALVLLLSLVTGYQGSQSTAAPAAGQAEDSRWQPFSAERIETLTADGNAVFVDFTAAWCLTCQVNKRTTLGSRVVQEAFDKKGVTLMRADWTSRDEHITRALESHGRSGVPLYVLYPGNGQKPALLPEVLTESIVLSALAPLPDRIAAMEQTSM